jgi:hypothetical protein
LFALRLRGGHMPATTDLQIIQVPIDELRPDPANPRRISDAELDALTRSLREFGFVQPVLARAGTGLVIGGHQRLLAARRLGWKQVPVIFIDVSDEEAHLLNLALNRISGAWDQDLLARLLSDLQQVPDLDLSLSGFEPVEIDQLLKHLESKDKRDRLETFDVDQALAEAAEREPITKPGDIWQLGDHRLLCGDSTSEADVARLFNGNTAVLMWIGYIQWLHDNGFGIPSSPILKPLHTIQHRDAILNVEAGGAIVQPEWPEVDVIIGNPPFLGSRLLRRGLQDDYVDLLFRLYDGQVSREADLVTYWFERAREHLSEGKAQRAGLLATQAIRGGANRRTLERIKETGEIFMAWSDREWILDGAAVHVSIVGFGDNDGLDPLLNGHPVKTINANLTSETDLTEAKRLKENLGLCFQGAGKVGPFEIDAETAQAFLLAPNPHGKPNSDVVRPWVNASHTTGRPSGLWIIDFGMLSEAEAALYEKPFEYLRRVVQPIRAT